MLFWQKCTVVLLGVVILGAAIFFARIVFRPVGLERYVSIPRVTYVHPNVKKLKRAQALVHEGKLNEARAILVKALITSPKSPVTRDLRDLLGDVNTQIFFSKEPSPRKTEYTVKRGDALASIARKLKSSAEAIIHVNDLDSTLIRPGEKLSVPQLDFTITIDLPRERVVVHDSHGFFTQYPIVSADLPPTRHPTIQTKVTAKSFWENGKPVQPTHGSEEAGTPRIDLGHIGYVLYGVEDESEAGSSEIAVEADDKDGTQEAPDPNRPPHGIAMLMNDITQIQLLIRKGTPVTIIRNREPKTSSTP
ncbi:MAG TPA: LysM peptidoglycan-binding domain-containing protein [Candidatus Udaeobacter sp.]|nr:LysM peptidoglycan-binding domain-containing protein [Candidatus Udaeobacter sp.]